MFGVIGPAPLRCSFTGDHDTLLMKYPCPCGHEIYDGPDQNPNIGHLIPDQDWFRLLDAIDAAIEGERPTAKDKEAACMSLRCLIGDISRTIWQCSACGRLWINDPEGRRQEFVPVTEAAKKILSGHHGPQPDDPGHSRHASR